MLKVTLIGFDDEIEVYEGTCFKTDDVSGDILSLDGVGIYQIDQFCSHGFSRITGMAVDELIITQTS